MPDNQLAERQPSSVKDYLALPAYRDRFHEVMGKRANQFMAAIVASSQLPGLKDAEPRSVIAAAMVAATLDLPVNPTLGQAHIVAYSDKGVKVAQFQIGYKGLIQLALRSGQYKRLNAGEVNAEVFQGYDLVGEPVLDWEQLDPLKPVAGYFCAFETLNGFTKVVYWSKPKAEAHARRFSFAYSKGYSTPWKSDFDSMATKTVIKAALSKWGLLSVEMQKAVVHDQGAQDDVDTDVKYVDNGSDETVPTDGAEPAKRAPVPERAKRGAAVVKANAAAPEVVVPEADQMEGDPAPAPEPAKAAPEPAKTITPAEPAKTVQQRVAPRASLNENETLNVVAHPVAIETCDITMRGDTKASVRITLGGGFLYKRALHFGGGEYVIDNGQRVREGKEWKVKPLPIWELGKDVNVSLVGRRVPEKKIPEVRDPVTGETTTPASIIPSEVRVYILNATPVEQAAPVPQEEG